jgi:hypothetical protein
VAELVTPDLGVRATVVMDRETHSPTVCREPGVDLREVEGDAFDGELVSELEIVSSWSAHVALYALQNPTPATIARALHLLYISGDFEDWTDFDGQKIAPVEMPDGWRERG